MDLDGITEACDTLGLLRGSVNYSDTYGYNVSISCPLAAQNHGDPLDGNKSCSVSIDPDGPSLAHCHSFSCGFGGTFYYLIGLMIRALKPPPEAFLDLLMRVGKVEEPSLERDFERAGVVFDTLWESKESLPSVSVKPTEEADSTRKKGRQPIHRAGYVRLYERDVIGEHLLKQFAKQPLPTYVGERGIAPKTAEVWGLGYDADLRRVTFPIRRFDGALIGVTGRILPEAEKKQKAEGYSPTKYHNYSGLNKTRYLYGAHTWKKGRPVVIVEGPVDLLKTWQAIGDQVNVGASLGQGFGVEHRLTVKNAETTAAYLFFDADAAGRRASEKVAAQLEHDLGLFLMKPDGGKDPGEMEDAAIITAYEKATPIIGDIFAALAGYDPLA